MKKLMTVSLLVAIFAVLASATPVATTKVGVVKFKDCVEQSQLGKKEQARFEQMRKDLESKIDAKEKELNDLAPKFSDEYLDTLTPEAESKLKNTFKDLNQQLAEMQDQYYKMLNQANYQIVQQLNSAVSKACEKVAKAKGLEMAINDEVCFYHAEGLDISKEVIAEMDRQSQQDEKKEEKK